VKLSQDRILTTHIGYSRVDPAIVYEKLGALAEGAALATASLWGGGRR